MEKIDLGNGVAMETVQETLARHALHAEHPTPNPQPPTPNPQPPKSPLSGGLVAQFPPDKGGKGG